MRKQLLFPVLLGAAQKLGINILIEPSRGMYGVILFDSGKKFYIRDINFNINLTNSVALAKNKAATSFFLKQFGYKVPEFTMVYRDEKCARTKSKDTVNEGLRYAERIGFPVILKPNNRSQGDFVFKAVNEWNYRDFVSEILSHCHYAQIQKFYSGNDYRIVVLGEKILSAYQRIPFYVIGDGDSSISDLIDKKQLSFLLSGRDTKLIKTDMRIFHKLAQQGLSLNSKPPYNEKIYLQDISNLSVGGETIELTNKVHDSFAKLALAIAKDMNLNLCGIDIIANDITQVNNDEYTVIEINSAPGLDNYAYEGLCQEMYVEKLYLEVLSYIKEKYS